MITSTTVTRRIVLDLDRCTGCRACGAACHVGHNDQTNLVPGVVADVAVLPGPVIEQLFRHPLSLERTGRPA